MPPYHPHEDPRVPKRDVRKNIYSEIEGTGVSFRNQLRRKLVNIFKEDFSQETCSNLLRFISQSGGSGSGSGAIGAVEGDLKESDISASKKKELLVKLDIEKRWAAECALRLEECLCARYRGGTKGYHDKARSLLFNLSNP